MTKKVVSINQEREKAAQRNQAEAALMVLQGHPSVSGPVSPGPRLEPPQAVIDLVAQANRGSLALGQDIEQYLTAVKDGAEARGQEQVAQIAAEALDFLAVSQSLNSHRMEMTQLKDLDLSGEGGYGGFISRHAGPRDFGGER